MSIANTYRFFVSPHTISGDRVCLDDPALTHQLGKVLRLHQGDRIILLDGLGGAYTVVLTTLGRTCVIGQVEQYTLAGGEPNIRLTLYVALMRAERFELVLQKGTELGVHTFVPVQYERSPARELYDERRLARWRRIVCEAAEQSGRGRVPIVAQPLSFSAASAHAADANLALLLWEGEVTPMRTILRAHAAYLASNSNSVLDNDAQSSSISVMSGPEGGITNNELTTSAEHGIISTSLGSRILRAETAPIVAAATIFYELD